MAQHIDTADEIDDMAVATRWGLGMMGQYRVSDHTRDGGTAILAVIDAVTGREMTITIAASE